MPGPAASRGFSPAPRGRGWKTTGFCECICGAARPIRDRAAGAGAGVMTKSRIAVVGGGPGGLFTAYLLNEFCGDLCEVVLFEAGPRLGGKVLTRRFDRAPVRYEAGVAELYDYSGT